MARADLADLRGVPPAIRPQNVRLKYYNVIDSKGAVGFVPILITIKLALVGRNTGVPPWCPRETREPLNMVRRSMPRRATTFLDPLWNIRPF